MNTNYFLFSCLPWVPDISLACGAVLGQRPINERLFMTLLPRGRTREKGLCHPGYFKLTFFYDRELLEFTSLGIYYCPVTIQWNAPSMNANEMEKCRRINGVMSHWGQSTKRRGAKRKTTETRSIIYRTKWFCNWPSYTVLKIVSTFCSSIFCLFLSLLPTGISRGGINGVILQSGYRFEGPKRRS